MHGADPELGGSEMVMKFLRRDEQQVDGPGGAPHGVDDGLSVPPFRPAPGAAPRPTPQTPVLQQPGKDPAMARSPFAPPQPQPQPVPTAGPGQPQGRPLPARAPEAGERRTLVVGRGISVQGTVQDAERLVVEGTVEATMIAATELAIAQGGVFKGEVEVEEAEIAGTIDGTLTARHALHVRETGKVLGTARCRRLQVEDGGQITGRIEMITEGAAGAAPRPAPAANAPEQDKKAAD